MSTEIEKKTSIIIAFDLITFKWYQTISLIGTVYESSTTFEITEEAAKQILNAFQSSTKIRSAGIDFHIK